MKLVFPASKNPVKRYTGISLAVICCPFPGVLPSGDTRVVLYAKKFSDLVFFYFMSYHTKSSCDFCRSRSDIRFARHIVKVYPLSVFSLYDAFCSEHHTVFFLAAKSLKGVMYGFGSESAGCLYAYTVKYLIRVMVMVMMIVVMVMIAMVVMVMMVMTAAAVIVVVVMFAVLGLQMAQSLFDGIFALHSVKYPPP